MDNKEMDFTQDVCFNFYVGWREVTALYKSLFGVEVSPQKVWVLLLCKRHPDIQMTEISEQLQLDASAVSTLVGRIEKQGLVSRLRIEEDRRAVVVNLTSKGRSELNTLRGKYTQLIQLMDEKFPKPSANHLHQMVKQFQETQESSEVL